MLTARITIENQDDPDSEPIIAIVKCKGWEHPGAFINFLKDQDGLDVEEKKPIELNIVPLDEAKRMIAVYTKEHRGEHKWTDEIAVDLKLDIVTANEALHQLKIEGIINSESDDRVIEKPVYLSRDEKNEIINCIEISMIQANRTIENIDENDEDVKETHEIIDRMKDIIGKMVKNDVD